MQQRTLRVAIALSRKACLTCWLLLLAVLVYQVVLASSVRQPVARYGPVAVAHGVIAGTPTTPPIKWHLGDLRVTDLICARTPDRYNGAVVRCAVNIENMGYAEQTFDLLYRYEEAEGHYLGREAALVGRKMGPRATVADLSLSTVTDATRVTAEIWPGTDLKDFADVRSVRKTSGVGSLLKITFAMILLISAVVLSLVAYIRHMGN